MHMASKLAFALVLVIAKYADSRLALLIDGSPGDLLGSDPYDHVVLQSIDKREGHVAIPRVFVSSTCYDLADIRDAIGSFCEGFGFDAVLSDRGDVFYHPDLHTHEACVFEVQNCHLLVLVIGGRFGGNYISDKTKSITNAEYAAARAKNIPVFCFVKQDVLDNHNLWQRNKDKTFSKEIIYPAIDKQEHAEDKFKFLDEVRHSTVNNGFFGFKLGRELEGLLRKQIAGMFFDFLSKRTLTKQIQTTNDAVNNLTLVANSIEQLVKSMYRDTKDQNAERVIEQVDKTAAAEAFFVEIARLAEDKQFIWKKKLGRLVDAPPPADWREGLVLTGYFQYGYDSDVRPADAALAGSERELTYLGIKALTDESGHLLDKDADTGSRLEAAWSIFRELPPETRKKILDRYSYEPKQAQPPKRAGSS